MMSEVKELCSCYWRARGWADRGDRPRRTVTPCPQNQADRPPGRSRIFSHKNRTCRDSGVK